MSDSGVIRAPDKVGPSEFEQNHITGTDSGTKRGLDVSIVSNQVNLSPILDTYIFHDLDDSGSGLTYLGYRDTSGNWLIKLLDDTSSPNSSLTYANVSNNATRTTYADGWSNRVTLSYGPIDDLTFDGSTPSGGSSVSAVKEFIISSDILGLANGSSTYLLGITHASKVSVFNNFTLSSSQSDVSFEFYEASTVSANGSALSGKDLNRVADATPSLLVYAGPTVTSDGTRLMKHIIYDAGKKVGGSEDMPEIFTLKASTNYLIKITNNSGSSADMTCNLYWKEY